MAKTEQSLLENKKIGHVIAALFYLFIGYFLFVAASNMNYIWKWTSVPKYFVYEKITAVEAPFDGVVHVKESGRVVVSSDDDTKELEIPADYQMVVNDGDDIF